MKSLRAGLGLILGSLLAGCDAPSPETGGSTGTAAPAARTDLETIVLSQPSDALTLDPYDENESPTFAVLANIFNALVDTDSDLQLIPSLAESWTQPSDTVWEFRLRPGVVFHSGDAFTADDVAFSLDRAINWTGSEVKADVMTIARTEVIDDHTVRIHTRGPDPILLNRLTGILMMDRESTEAAVAEHGDGWTVEHPNGTGPYRLVSWRREEAIDLEAFPRFWGGEPDIQHVRFRPITNDATRIAALLAGDVHLITDVPVRDTGRIENSPTLQLIRNPSLRLIYLGMDCGREQTPGVPGSPPNPFMDQRVRRAIYLAIDEEQIAEHVMNGFAVPAGQLVPDAVFGFDPSITRPAHDLEEARRLLTEAGYPDGFSCTLDAPNNRYVNDERIATAIASQLARVRIIVSVAARPKTVFFEDEQQGRSSFFLIGWSNSNGDASGTFEYLLHTNTPERNLGSSNNSSHYSNPELDAAIQAAAVEIDRDERRRLLQRCMQIAMQDLPHIPLHYQVDLFAAVRGLDWQPRRDTRLQAFEMHWRDEAP